MIIFPIVIVVSLILYVYYKVTIIRSKDMLQQVYLNAKAKISLGVFISFFGINQYLFYETKFALYVTIVFVILGVAQIISGFKRTKHYANEIKKREQS
ncbi:YtpI family protein [Aquibacillus koreensis]|uniref:YtpI family protein n=1 Tax=Aquibacillus koreensis TaxID=279446 RepID=A0A9X4AIF9_9BACI|nr:YtpI family protein [Aquibacillus koreensis]MCT2537170.1 YtpI family protein [Aquibacillus koreensis]MDC3419258.1 YtpI family protein [Aquibacillus koreensis]